MPETTNTDEIMQAAERLRRVHAGLNLKDAQELYGNVWPTNEDNWVVNAIREDRLKLSHWALSILPKGKRPVPITQGPGASGYVWWGAWGVRFASWDSEFDGGCLMVHVGGSRYGTTTATLFATEQEAADDQWLRTLMARSAS